MKLIVTDPGLKASLLLHMVEKIERGELHTLLESGNSPECLDQLRQLDIASLMRLVHIGCPEVTFRVVDESIKGGLDTLQRQNNENDDLIYFIQNGATQSMLGDLFRMNGDVIQSYRKLLSQESKPGRTTLPNEKLREGIQQHWYTLEVSCLTKAETLRKKLRLLHGQFNDVSIDMLYATINEFEEVLPKRKPS
ncbi:MAG: DUF2857 family protein [Methylophilaceae bacterium]|nr:DUF2857 family protein [Methylophilaceae bacterium]